VSGFSVHAILLGVVPVVKGLTDFVLQVVVVLHVLLDLRNWQLDEHTGDLWCFVLTDESLNELVDATTDLVFHVRVVWVQSWDVLHGLGLISLSDGHVTGVHWHLGWYHWHSLSRWWHVLLWHWLLLLLLHHHLLVLVGWWHVLLLHVHVLVHLLLLVHLSLVLLHVGSTHVLVVVVSTLDSSWASLVVLLVSSSVHVTTLVHLLVGLLIVLDDAKQLLKHLGQVRLGGQVIPLESTSLLGLVLLPISLVTGLFHLELSDFLDLVVVDQEHLTLNAVVLQVLLSLGSIGGLLVANEGKGISSLLAFVKSDVLNVTEGLEEVGQIILGVVVWEVLHIQVASFL